MPVTATEVGRFLRKAREKSGLTQKELSVAIGYTSAQIISNVERGLAGPPLLKVVSWCEKVSANPKKVKLLMIKRYKKQLEEVFYENRV